MVLRSYLPRKWPSIPKFSGCVIAGSDVFSTFSMLMVELCSILGRERPLTLSLRSRVALVRYMLSSMKTAVFDLQNYCWIVYGNLACSKFRSEYI